MLIKVLDLIQQRTGIALKDSRLERAESLVRDMLEQAQFNERTLHQALLDEPLSSQLWQAFIQEVTVGETYFFRNRAHFHALRQHILPGLIQKRRRQGQLYLRLWIAAAATGEEAYSLAMLLVDMIPDLSSWSIFLLATDINEAFLSLARAGVYRDRAFRSETPNDIKPRWFTPHPERGYVISPQLRQMVTFMPMNLADDVYPSLSSNTVSLDLIMCRNVTIYFDIHTTRQVVNRFHAALAPGGWLFVGHSEPQSHVYDAFQTVNADGAILYQKPAPCLLSEIEQPVPAPPVDAKRPDNRVPPADQTLPPLSPIPPTVNEDLTDVDDLLALAQAAADREAWETALALLEQAEPDNRFNPTLHYLQGLVFTHTNNRRAAIQAFRRAVYCEPRFALAYYALGELLCQEGEKKDARLNWQRAHKILRHSHPDAPVVGASDLTVEMLRELVAYRLA